MIDKRAQEIRRLNSLPVNEVRRLAGEHLVVVDHLDALHQHFADSIAERLKANNSRSRRTVLILPYGPVGQYPLLRKLLHTGRISMRECLLFFMDDYADSGGRAIDPSHPLSFRGAVERWIESIDEQLRPLKENVVFPNERNASEIADLMHAAGGVEACYGGIGIHGHVAFNEPEPGVSKSRTRLVELNDFTRTINAMRAGVGGDLENFPRRAWTLGLTDCLAAKHIELYCRNDHGLEWANTVLRLALFGEPGDDYPVTWIRSHASYRIVTDRNTLSPPTLQL